MVRGILLFIIGFIVFLAIVLTILFHKAIRTLNMFRSNTERKAERAAKKAAEEEEYFRRTSKKYYDASQDKPKFDKDYFKSTGEGNENKQQQQQQQQQRQTSRKTTTNEGVTIIDHRDESASSRKIFSENEGEYTEFEEVQ